MTHDPDGAVPDLKAVLDELLPGEIGASHLFDRVTLSAGEERDTSGEIHVLIRGAVRVRYEAPLRGKASCEPAIGEVFGGEGLLEDEVLRDAPELQMVRGVFTASTESELLVLPQHLARREPGLAQLVDRSLGELVLQLNRALLRDALRGDERLAKAQRGRLEALLAAGRVVPLETSGEPTAVPAGGVAVVLWGAVNEAGGERALDRFSVVAGGRELTTDASGLLLIIDELSAPMETQRKGGWAALESSARWRQVPEGLNPEALFVEQRYKAGEILSNSSGRGQPAADASFDGGLFFLLEGELKISSGPGAAARTRKRRSWVGGDAWLGKHHARLMAVGLTGVYVAADTDVRVLVAPPPDPELPDWERSAIRRLACANLICEANRAALSEALGRISGLRGCTPAALKALVERGDVLLLKRGARLQAPAGELYIPLQANLNVIPLSGDQRFIPSPPAFVPLGATEFFTDGRPEVAWEARRACWMFRLTRAAYRACRRSSRVRLPPLVSRDAGFDRSGGAELVMVDGDPGLFDAMPAMVDCIAQAMVDQFDDMVLVARLGGPESRAGSAIREGGPGQPDRVRWRPKSGALTLESLTPALTGWNDDYAFIFLIPCDKSGALDPEGQEAIASLAERLIFLTGDPTQHSALPVSMDCATHYAILLPEKPWHLHILGGAPAWAPAGRHPGFPDGAVRLRLKPEGYKTPKSLKLLPDEDQRRFERWARGLTERQVGVALGGGGAYGFVHIALLMELERSGIPVDAVSGASVGATVGAVYSAGGAVGLQEFVRLSFRLQRVMSLNMFTMRFMSGFMDALLAHLDNIKGELPHPSKQELEDGHWPVLPPEKPRGSRRRRLKNALSWSPFALLNLTRVEHDGWTHNRSLQDFEVPFFPVATDLETGGEVALEVGPVAEGVRASGSFPLASPPTPHPYDPSRQLIDGGFAANIPDAVLHRQGIGLVVASNPIPPPSRSSLVGEQGPRFAHWPLVKRGFQAYRASHILMHTVGHRERRDSAATYNAPPSTFGIMDLDKSADIARLPYEQEEFHETLQDIRQSWERLQAPRRPEGLVVRRRDEEWTDLARTGWAVVFPEGVTRRSAVFKAVAPLIKHRRRQIRERGSTSCLQVFLGRSGYKPGQSVAQFLEAAGVREKLDPARLGYHVLLVGSPEEIPFDFQMTLDIEYAVGRLWFDDPESIRSYVERLLRFEHERPASPQHIDVACLATDGVPARTLDEQLLPALENALRTRLPEWRIRRLGPDAGGSVEETARAIFGGGQSDLMVAAGQTWLGWEGLKKEEEDQVGWPLIGRERVPMDAVRSGRAPRVVFLYGGATGGIDVRSRYAFMKTPPPLTYPDRPLISGFARAMLAWENGPLALVGKLDVSWLVAPFEGRQSETFALSEALELVASGRTVGASMQSNSDLYHRKKHLANKVDRLGTELDPRQTEGLRLSIENARCWLLLGDPAVRLTPSAR